MRVICDFFYTVVEFGRGGKCMPALMGDFEAATILAITRLADDAYGMRIRQELESRLGRRVSIGAVYTTLDRMKEKGYVRASVGESTPERGGRAKKYFKVEALGYSALNRTRQASDAIWAGLPSEGR
jgi:PadR family transcriptional regulator